MSVDKLFTTLERREPHLKSVLGEMSICQIDDKNFSCAAISLEPGYLNLIINKRKFNALFTEEKLAVLAHELGHFALGHLSFRSYPQYDRFIVSLAQDLALNAGLEKEYRLPDWFVTAAKINLPNGLSTSQYIPLIEKIGKAKLAKVVKIPDVKLHIDVKGNQKIVKSIVDKVRVNPHLVISNQ